MKDGISNKEILNDLCYPVLYRVEQLEGKCKHRGAKTDPAYCDIRKAIYGPDLRSNIIDKAITKALHLLEEMGQVEVSEKGYYCRGTHGGAGAKKWKITEKGRQARER